MATLQAAGVTVHYRETGAGQPVVLLHGGGSSGAQWRGVAERLADRWRLVTVDHYGHGGTAPWPGEPEARSHDAEAALVAAVIARVGGPVHLVGHSYGGGVALRLVLARPAAVASLTLIEPIALSLLRHAGEDALCDAYRDFALAFIRDAAAGDVEGAWERFIDGNGEPGSWARLPPESRARMLAMTDSIVSGWHANLNHATTPAECAAIAAPTLMVHGSATRPHFRRLTEVLAGLISGARLQVLAGVGHMSPLTHPDAVAEALAAHLAQHPAA